MNLAKLSQQIAQKTGANKALVADVLREYQSAIKQDLEAGRPVHLTGIATLLPAKSGDLGELAIIRSRNLKI